VKAKGHSTSSAHAICTSANAGNVRATRKKERGGRRIGGMSG
jgi:hypothetical protein